MRTTERKEVTAVADGFILERPIHFPDGTEAKELPLYEDMKKLFVEEMRRLIDEQRKKEGKV